MRKKITYNKKKIPYSQVGKNQQIKKKINKKQQHIIKIKNLKHNKLVRFRYLLCLLTQKI